MPPKEVNRESSTKGIAAKQDQTAQIQDLTAKISESKLGGGDKTVDARKAGGSDQLDPLSSENRPDMPEASGKYKQVGAGHPGVPGFLPGDVGDAERGERRSPIRDMMRQLDVELQRSEERPDDEGKATLAHLINKYKPEPETGKQVSARKMTDVESEQVLTAVKFTDKEKANFKVWNVLSASGSQASKVTVASANYIGIPYIMKEHGFNAATIAGSFITSILGVGVVGSLLNGRAQTTLVAILNDIQRHNAPKFVLPDNITDNVSVPDKRGEVQQSAFDNLSAHTAFANMLRAEFPTLQNELEIAARNPDEASRNAQILTILNRESDALLACAEKINTAATTFLDNRDKFLKDSAELNMGKNAQTRHEVTHDPQLPSRAERGATSAFFPAITEKAPGTDFGHNLNKMAVISSDAGFDASKGAFGHNVLLSIGGAMLGEGRKQMYGPKEVVTQPQAMLNEAGLKRWEAGQDIDPKRHFRKGDEFPRLVQRQVDRHKAAILGEIEKDIKNLDKEVKNEKKSPGGVSKATQDKLDHAKKSKVLLETKGFEAFNEHDPIRGRQLEQMVIRENRFLPMRYFDSKSEIGQDIAKKRKVDEGRWFSLEELGQDAQQLTSAFLGIGLGTVSISILQRLVTSASGGADKTNPVASLMMTVASIAFGIAYSKAQPMLIQIKRGARAEISDAKDKAKEKIEDYKAKNGGQEPPKNVLDKINSDMRSAQNKALLKQIGRGLFVIFKEYGLAVKNLFTSEQDVTKALEDMANQISLDSRIAEAVQGATQPLLAGRQKAKAQPEDGPDVDPTTAEGLSSTGGDILASLREAVNAEENMSPEDLTMYNEMFAQMERENVDPNAPGPSNLDNKGISARTPRKKIEEFEPAAA